MAEDHSNPPLPEGHVTVFDKAYFEKMIKFVEDERYNLEHGLLSPTGGVWLDDSTGAAVMPGNTNWKPAASYIKSAGDFGSSAHTQLQAIAKRWKAFAEQLQDAKIIFEKTSDLATASASEFTFTEGGATGA